MANINISELRPAGSELFQDSESYLNELNDREMDAWGGDGNVLSVASQNSASVGSINTLSNAVVTQSISQSQTFFF